MIPSSLQGGNPLFDTQHSQLSAPGSPGRHYEGDAPAAAAATAAAADPASPAAGPSANPLFAAGKTGKGILDTQESEVSQGIWGNLS